MSLPPEREKDREGEILRVIYSVSVNKRFGYVVGRKSGRSASFGEERAVARKSGLPYLIPKRKTIN